MFHIPEEDWKIIRAIKDKKLDAICADILDEINREIKNKEDNNHKAYLKVWDIVNRRDKEIAEMFNDLKRSNAVFKLSLWYINGYLTEQELNKFTHETQSAVNTFCEYKR